MSKFSFTCKNGLEIVKMGNNNQGYAQAPDQMLQDDEQIIGVYGNLGPIPNQNYAYG